MAITSNLSAGSYNPFATNKSFEQMAIEEIQRRAAVRMMPMGIIDNFLAGEPQAVTALDERLLLTEEEI